MCYRKTAQGVEWAHIMDAALAPSTINLAHMVARNLRENRHPAHAAKVRENVLPVQVSHHFAMDHSLSALFLHEDILARTLSYEQDLHEWRLAELTAGRPDPGRPSYTEVFGSKQQTEHRYHCAQRFDDFLRNEGNTSVIYTSRDCPGIDTGSTRCFPIINTLLSIPFSILYNLPRLGALVAHSDHQMLLSVMATKIIQLWWWDPPQQIVHSVTATANQTPIARPRPINHPSRMNITFSSMKLMIDSPSRSAVPAEPAIDCPILTHTRLVAEGLPMDDKEDDLQRSITGSRVVSEMWTESEDQHATDDIRDKTIICPSSSDIVLWSQEVVESEPELTPLTHTSFERGVIPSMSANDVLMIKGLISPVIYIAFIDLASFS